MALSQPVRALLLIAPLVAVTAPDGAGASPGEAESSLTPAAKAAVVAISINC